MAVEYVHTPMFEDVEFLCGSYFKVLEGRLPYDGREVLYFVGGTSSINTCCGSSLCGISYIKVPGFVTRWQSHANGDGLPVSEVEPIRDAQVQDTIASLLQERHGVSQVEFW